MNMLKVKSAPYIAESENVYKKINKQIVKFSNTTMSLKEQKLAPKLKLAII